MTKITIATHWKLMAIGIVTGAYVGATAMYIHNANRHISCKELAANLKHMSTLDQGAFEKLETRQRIDEIEMGGECFVRDGADMLTRDQAENRLRKLFEAKTGRRP